MLVFTLLILIGSSYGQWYTYTNYVIFPLCKTDDVCYNNYCIRQDTNPSLTYCIVNGNPTPDLQIGYTGPCNMATIAAGVFCVNCQTGYVCTNKSITNNVVATYTGVELLGGSFFNSYSTEVNMVQTPGLGNYNAISQNIIVNQCNVLPDASDDTPENIDPNAYNYAVYPPSALYNMKNNITYNGYVYGFNAIYSVLSQYGPMGTGNYQNILTSFVLQFGALQYTSTEIPWCT